MVFDGDFMLIQWDVHWIWWDFNGILMGSSWDFLGTTPWDSKGFALWLTNIAMENGKL